MKAKVTKVLADKEEAFTAQLVAVQNELETARRESSLHATELEKISAELRSETAAKQEAVAKLQELERHLEEEKEVRASIEMVGSSSAAEMADMNETIDRLKGALAKAQEDASKSVEESHTSLHATKTDLKVTNHSNHT